MGVGGGAPRVHWITHTITDGCRQSCNNACFFPHSAPILQESHCRVPFCSCCTPPALGCSGCGVWIRGLHGELRVCRPRHADLRPPGCPPPSHPIPCVSGRFTVLSVRCRFEPHVFGTICYSFFGFTHGGCSNEAEPEIAVGLALQNYDIPCENLPKSQRLQPCVRFLYL